MSDNGGRRVERDSMGEMSVPAAAYYGASTARAVENFPISDMRFPRAFLAALGLIFRREDRATRRLVATWGWGSLAVLVAALVYGPWYRFVESHGGYAALMAHHRSYLSGITSLTVRATDPRIFLMPLDSLGPQKVHKPVKFMGQSISTP